MTEVSASLVPAPGVSQRVECLGPPSCQLSPPQSSFIREVKLGLKRQIAIGRLGSFFLLDVISFAMPSFPGPPRSAKHCEEVGIRCLSLRCPSSAVSSNLPTTSATNPSLLPLALKIISR